MTARAARRRDARGRAPRAGNRSGSCPLPERVAPSAREPSATGKTPCAPRRGEAMQHPSGCRSARGAGCPVGRGPKWAA